MRDDDPDALLAQDPSLPRLSDADFALFQSLIRREVGIHLSDGKRALLVARLAPRLRALGLKSFRHYYLRVTEEDEEEFVTMLDRISTNETRFFRGPQHFEMITNDLSRTWVAEADRGARERVLRAWSAGCATGEEPYSLAMCLLAALPAGWKVDILATDISTRALEKARRATWPVARSGEIPTDLLRRFVLRGTRSQEGMIKMGPEVRAAVRFARLNLNDANYPLTEPMDLVFCRNVLIYFDAETRPRIMKQLFSHLAPHGLLFVGHAETLVGAGMEARVMTPTVYGRRGP
jgi:chemotaxis protein methyltransferase CheR